MRLNKVYYYKIIEHFYFVGILISIGLYHLLVKNISMYSYLLSSTCLMFLLKTTIYSENF